MSEWKTYRMEDVAELCLGKMLDAKKNKGTLRPYLNNVSVRWGSFDLSDLPMMRFEDSEIERYVARKGDIVACEGGEPGRCAMWKSDTPIFLQKAVHRIRVKKGFDPCFVYYDFRYLVTSGKTAHLETGSTIRHLPGQALKEVELAIPDLPTQRRIAAVLGALDDKIENNRKICENLEAQAQALFKSWFVDFEPWGGKMPEEWKKGKLGDLAECNPFRRLPKGVDARCVEMADLVTNGAFPSGWSTKKYTGGMKFRNGDTIVARITPCFENGKAAFINFLEEDEVGFGSTEYVVISSCSAAPGGLFYSLVKSPDFITYAKSRMVGSSGRQRFNAEDVASFPLTIAPNNVYLELAPYYESIMEKIAQCGKESRALAEMRDALLPQLMSGRLRVDATACQGEIDVGKVEI